jgi:hypothetical protein
MKTTTASLNNAMFATAGLIASLCSLVPSAHGTVLVNERFDYIAGELDAVSGSTWTAVSAPGSNPPQVIAGVVTDLDAGSEPLEDNAIAFGATTTMLFYGLDVSFTGPFLPTGASYFAAFRNGVSEVGRMFLGAPAGGALNSFASAWARTSPATAAPP